MRPIILIGLLISSPAFAGYATPNGCGYETNDFTEITDSDAYFDGRKLRGWEWGCEIEADGQASCWSEDTSFEATFTVTIDGDTATIRDEANDKTFVMERCP